MYEKSDKKIVYQIMDLYLSGTIDESTFCDEFYLSFDLEIDFNTLTKNEYEAFSELGKMSSRFSPFPEDHQKYPGVYSTEEELKEKIIETKIKLSKK